MAEARHQTYMLDTNVFNDVLDGKILPTLLAGHLLFVTGVQASELQATKKTERRESLLTIFKDIAPTSLLASSFAFDIEGAGFDQAYWNDGSGNFDKMLARLRTLDHKNKECLNQSRDILIAETAIKNGAILVSGDHNLRQVVSEFGGRAISLSDLPCFIKGGT
jgi:predicted nucleic acid-binding protein